MAARFVLGTATLSTTTLLFEHYNSAVAPSYIGTKVQITAKCETVPQEITVVFQDGGNIDIPSGASVLIQGKTTFELEAPAPGNPPAPGFTVEGSFISNVGAGQVLEMHVNYTGPNGALSFLNNGAILMFSNVVTAGTVVAEAVTVTFQDSVVTFSEVIPPQNATALSALFVNVRSDQPSNLGSVVLSHLEMDGGWAEVANLNVNRLDVNTGTLTLLNASTNTANVVYLNGGAISGSPTVVLSTPQLYGPTDSTATVIGLTMSAQQLRYSGSESDLQVQDGGSIVVVG